eukprot:Skav225081  [mRNA]  locus=scaffold987:264609:272268:- [translate_table: standard]
MWDWLHYTVPDIFWVEDPPSPMLNTYNQLIGYFSIRVQCLSLKSVVGGGCCWIQVNNAKLVEDFNVMTKENGNNVNQTLKSQGDSKAVVRGLSDPGVFRSATENRVPRRMRAQEKHNIRSIHGDVATYDGSGYSVDYRMTVTDPDEHEDEIDREMRKRGEETRAGEHALGDDLQVLKNAGVVIMSFTTYNYDYDMWTASDFMWEIPPDGQILPSISVKPFKPRMYETSPLKHNGRQGCGLFPP